MLMGKIFHRVAAGVLKYLLSSMISYDFSKVSSVYDLDLWDFVDG